VSRTQQNKIHVLSEVKSGDDDVLAVVKEARLLGVQIPRLNGNFTNAISVKS